MTKSLLLSAAATLPLLLAAPAQAAGLDRLEHIVVIYLENHSFDNMYALYPGADDLAAPKAAWAPQTDGQGRVLAHLPPVYDAEDKRPDRRFPPHLVNAPFLIDQYVPQNQTIPDLVHRFYQAQEQIDGGRMDRFASVSDAGGLTMGYYDTRNTAMWALAQRFTLADHYFQGAFGGSFLNHAWLICACTPRFPQAPAALTARLDGQGHLLKDGAVTPDGYAVNTVYGREAPHPARIPAADLLPPQTLPTIGDRLSAKGISWAWYSGGWDKALAGHPDPTFQYHHQPFAYFARYGDGTPGGKPHLKDERDFAAAIAQGRLPAVAFYKPLGIENQHPGYATIENADIKAAALIDKIMAGPQWRRTAIIVTYDENGGFWDHVAPPKGDRWGPGARVPALILSPFARRHWVDHHVYDTTSILKLIEARWHLAPLGRRDAAADGFSGAFDFSGG